MNIIDQNFLNYFNSAIDSLLEPGALSIDCTLIYENQASITLCNNCVYDHITKSSSNVYNGIGPQNFPEYSICPICLGSGRIQSNNHKKIISLAVIFDGKYFINVNKNVQIPAGTIQTLCSSKYTIDIRNATSLFINNVNQYGQYNYERAEDPVLCGLGDTNYIITTWNRK